MEDPLSNSELAAADAQSREALVRAEALAALAAEGCVYPTLFLPGVAEELAAIHVGDGILRVFAVDGKGEVRNGPRGPETVTDVVSRWQSEHPTFFAAKHSSNSTPSKPRHTIK